MAIRYKRNINRRRQLSKNTKISGLDGFSIFIMIILLLIGVVLGSFSAAKMDKHEYTNISETIKASLEGLNPESISKIEVFSQSIFRNARIVLVIWIAGFFSIGSVVSLFVLGYKGYGIGYTVSVFLLAYGKKGILLSFGTFLIQNIALITICLFIAHYYIYGISLWLKGGGRINFPLLAEIDITERFVILLISIAGVFIIGLYEAYICPWICFLIF